MATKTDYYDRIIASLQAEITALKTTLANQQKEIEEIRAKPHNSSESNKTSHISLSSLPKPELNMLLSKVKEVCDAAIRLNHKNYREIFATRQELEALRDSFKTTFLSSVTFNDYCRSQETRLKAIEEKLNRRFYLLKINLYGRKGGINSQNYFQIDSILNFFQRVNSQWVIPILVFFSICMFAIYLFGSIFD